jgi:hypothetical protein
MNFTGNLQKLMPDLLEATSYFSRFDSYRISFVEGIASVFFAIKQTKK